MSVVFCGVAAIGDEWKESQRLKRDQIVAEENLHEREKKPSPACPQCLPLILPRGRSSFSIALLRKHPSLCRLWLIACRAGRRKPTGPTFSVTFRSKRSPCHTAGIPTKRPQNNAVPAHFGQKDWKAEGRGAGGLGEDAGGTTDC